MLLPVFTASTATASGPNLNHLFFHTKSGYAENVGCGMKLPNYAVMMTSEGSLTNKQEQSVTSSSAGVEVVKGERHLNEGLFCCILKTCRRRPKCSPLSHCFITDIPFVSSKAIRTYWIRTSVIHFQKRHIRWQTAALSFSRIRIQPAFPTDYICLSDCANGNQLLTFKSRIQETAEKHPNEQWFDPETTNQTEHWQL